MPIPSEMIWQLSQHSRDPKPLTEINLIRQNPPLTDDDLDILFEAFEGNPNVSALNLNYNQITKLPKAIPQTIKAIYLAGNKIENINDLDINSENLEILELSDNQINSIQGLDHVPNLKKLFLNKNKIGTTQGLDKVSKLESLSLVGNNIQNITGLNNLPNLKFLDLTSNKIKTIKELAQLVKLEKLFLSNNEIGSMQGLNDLVNLESLLLDNNKISKIEGLASLTKLKVFSLSDNPLGKAIAEETLTLIIKRNETIAKAKNLDEKRFIHNQFAAALNYQRKHISLKENAIYQIGLWQAMPESAATVEIAQHINNKTLENLPPELLEEINKISGANKK